MGKPTTRNGVVSISEFIGYEKADPGTETSKYPEEEKANAIPWSSGERNGISPNQEACLLGL